jgi:hypothetical protein
MITHTADTVTIWPTTGTPQRLTWAGVRYRVTDSPTPLTEEVYSDALTHPFEKIIGWRFQGTDGHGVAHVFDVHRIPGRQEWELVTVYD